VNTVHHGLGLLKAHTTDKDRLALRSLVFLNVISYFKQFIYKFCNKSPKSTDWRAWV